VEFEVDLLKSLEINLDYILELIFDQNKKTKSKTELVDELGDKSSVIEAFFAFAQAEQQREAKELINEENLNIEEAKRYITTSIKREYASYNGTELNAILPKMSQLNPQYLTKKQSVFQKVAAFVE